MPPMRDIQFPKASTVESKYAKHASDFGMTGKFDSESAELFQQTLEGHVINPNVDAISGTFRGMPVNHFVDPASGLNVMTDPLGNFVSGFKLNPTQLWNVLNRGSL
jgi:hypothetical protein